MLAVGCAPVEQAEVDPYANGAAGDRAAFIPQRLVSDVVFADGEAFDAGRIDEMLEATPWGKSFLATYEEDGRSTAELVAETARAHSVNPLVLLTLLQTQRGLLSQHDDPGARRIHDGLCPGKDGDSLTTQLACAAELLHEAYEAGTRLEPTVSGRRIDKTFTTVDGIRVTPANRAALAIYTYAPTYGAAELFFQVFRQLAEHYGYEDALVLPFNEGYIGGACQTQSDCLYAGAECLAIDGRKECTLPCDRTCPDRKAPGFAQTFCVDSSAAPSGRGLCVAKCDARQSPTRCGEGFACEPNVTRFNEPSRTADVCVPDGAPSEDPSEEPVEPTPGEPGESVQELTFLLTLSNIDGEVEANLLADTWNSSTLFGVTTGFDRYELTVEPADEGQAWSEYGGLVVPTLSFIDTIDGMVPVELASVTPEDGHSIDISDAPLSVDEFRSIAVRGDEAEVATLLRSFELGENPALEAELGSPVPPISLVRGEGRLGRGLPSSGEALAIMLNLAYSTALIQKGEALLDKGENLTVELPVRLTARAYRMDSTDAEACLYEY